MGGDATSLTFALKQANDLFKRWDMLASAAPVGLQSLPVCLWKESKMLAQKPAFVELLLKTTQSSFYSISNRKSYYYEIA